MKRWAYKEALIKASSNKTLRFHEIYTQKELSGK